jgi:hypothetical protein
MKKIKDVRERLLSDPIVMPSWIYVSPSSAPSVVSALDYWLKAAPEKTVKGILQNHECRGPLDSHEEVLGMSGLSAEFRERVQSSRSRTERQVADVVDGMSDAHLQSMGICPAGLSMSEARKFIKDFMVDEWLDQHGLGRTEGRTSLRKKWIGIRR